MHYCNKLAVAFVKAQFLAHNTIAQQLQHFNNFFVQLQSLIDITYTILQSLTSYIARNCQDFLEIDSLPVHTSTSIIHMKGTKI